LIAGKQADQHLSDRDRHSAKIKAGYKQAVAQLESYKKINIYSSSGFKFDIRRKLYTNWFGMRQLSK